MYSTPGPWSWPQCHWTFVAPEETAATARGQPPSPRDYSQQQQHHYSRWQSGAHHNSFPSAGLVASSPAAASEYARPPGDVTEDEWLPCFAGAEFPALLHDPISNSRYRHPPTSTTTTTTLYPSPEPPATTSITTKNDNSTNNNNNDDDGGYDYCHAQPSHANSPSPFQQNNPWDNQHRHHHHQHQHASTLSSYDMVYGAPAPLTNSLDVPPSTSAAASHHHHQQAPGLYPIPSTQPHATAAATAYPFAGCRCTCHPLCYATPYSAQPPPWQAGSTQQEHDGDGDDDAPPQDDAVRQHTWGVAEHPALPACLTLDHPQVTRSSSSSVSSPGEQKKQKEQQSTLLDTTPLPNQALDTPAPPNPSQQPRTNPPDNQASPTTATTTPTTRKRGRSSLQGYDASTPLYCQPPQDATIMPPPPPPRVVPILHSQTAAAGNIIGSSSSLRPGSQRPNVDEVVYRGRREGLSYAEIKRGWRLPQSESTLRGRYHKIKRRFEREGS